MANNDSDSEGCVGCIALIVLGGIIWAVVAIVHAYVSAITGERVLYAILAALPTGLIVGALVSLVAGKYRQKASLGPLPFLAYFHNKATLQKKYLPSSADVTSAEETDDAEDVVDAETVDATTADPSGS